MTAQTPASPASPSPARRWPAAGICRPTSIVPRSWCAAAARGAQIILIQELFEAPYFCIEQQARHFGLASSLEESATIRRFQALAKSLKVVLPVSWFERAGRAFFNSVAIIDADGSVLGVYRKSHIPNDVATRRSSTSRPATPAFASGTRPTRRSVWRSAGTSGFRRPHAPWRCRAPN